MKILCRISFRWDEINSFFAKFFSEIFPLLLMHIWICMKIKQRLRTRLLTHGKQKLMFEFYSSSFQMLTLCLFVCFIHVFWFAFFCLVLALSLASLRVFSSSSFCLLLCQYLLFFLFVLFLIHSLPRTHTRTRTHTVYGQSHCASVG